MTRDDGGGEFKKQKKTKKKRKERKTQQQRGGGRSGGDAEACPQNHLQEKHIQIHKLYSDGHGFKIKDSLKTSCQTQLQGRNIK